MGNFYSDTIQKSAYFHSTNACRDIALLEPGFRARVSAMIADANAHGHDLRLLETYRSQARQQHLYAQGRTAPGPVVTHLQKVGVHGYGLAADIGLFDKGKKLDPVGEHYAFFVALCAKYHMVSGIDWGAPNAQHSFKDWDHVQGVPLFRQPALFAGTWYPEQGYDPLQDQIAHGAVA
jgi:hypothetical protein